MTGFRFVDIWRGRHPVTQWTRELEPVPIRQSVMRAFCIVCDDQPAARCEFCAQSEGRSADRRRLAVPIR